MVSVSLFASVVAPLLIAVIILFVLVFLSRSSIGALRKDYKDLKESQEIDQELKTGQIQELFDQSNSIGLWAMASQRLTPVPQDKIDEIYEEIYCPEEPGCSQKKSEDA